MAPSIVVPEPGAVHADGRITIAAVASVHDLDELRRLAVLYQGRLAQVVADAALPPAERRERVEVLAASWRTRYNERRAELA